MTSDSAPVSAAPVAAVLLEPLAILLALNDPARYAALRHLAISTDPLSVNDLATRLSRTPDNMSKHMRVLRHARMVRLVTPPGADGRKQFHEIPAPFLSRDAAGKTVVDYGAVVLRFG